MSEGKEEQQQQKNNNNNNNELPVQRHLCGATSFTMNVLTDALIEMPVVFVAVSTFLGTASEIRAFEGARVIHTESCVAAVVRTASALVDIWNAIVESQQDTYVSSRTRKSSFSP